MNDSNRDNDCSDATDSQEQAWPAEARVVKITSSADGCSQAAYYHASRGSRPRPLVVSLHTWSYDYRQADPLAQQTIRRNLNYIHPDFRGPNDRPEACGSPLVISDIDDAIAWAVANGNVDPDDIHVIGLSGGGMATLLAYMKSRHDIRSFSAWVPISNLVDWFHESLARRNEFARHIAQATTGRVFVDGLCRIDEEEAIRRSPVFMNTPVEKRKRSTLRIHAGVHDGYLGSVPITHSINMYNKLIGDFDPAASSAPVPAEDIITLLTHRGFPAGDKARIGEREVHYRRAFMDLLELTLFEGGHEMLSEVALDHIGA